MEHLEKMAANQENTDTTEIGKVPEKGTAGKIAMWIIPVLIVALIGFAPIV